MLKTESIRTLLFSATGRVVIQGKIRKGAIERKE